MPDSNSKMRLINVIMLVGCVGIVLLLAPAWNLNSRRLARLHSCKNHLRQFGIATTAYHTQKDRLPGYVVDYGIFKSGLSPSHSPELQDTIPTHRKVGTWAVALLPYLDQQAIYEHWSTAAFPILSNLKQDAATSGFTARLPGLRFDPMAKPDLATMRCPESTVPLSASNLSYVVNNGMAIAEDSSAFRNSMSVSNAVIANQFAGLLPNGEPVATGPNRSLNDIADGKSSTLLFTENLQAEPWHRAGFSNPKDLLTNSENDMIAFPAGARFTQGVVWHSDGSENDLGGVQRVPSRRINATVGHQTLDKLRMKMQNAADLSRPSSSHPGTVNLALADGAIKTIAESIDYCVYAALLCPNDAESDLPAPDLETVFD